MALVEDVLLQRQVRGMDRLIELPIDYSKSIDNGAVSDAVMMAVVMVVEVVLMDILRFLRAGSGGERHLPQRSTSSK